MVLLLLSLSSCLPKGRLVTHMVGYQSIRTTEFHENVPESAQIAVGYTITRNGELLVLVANKTDEVMVIDQTKSFFVNTNGISTSYFDPTIQTTSTTDISSNSGGVSANLGAIGRVVGIGGPVGSLLSGINVGGSTTTGQSVTNTTYKSDLPQISLAPKSSVKMSKDFPIYGVGVNSFIGEQQFFNTDKYSESPLRFSCCISYSLDGGVTFDKLVSDFYVSSKLIVPVKKHGQVNVALRGIYDSKSDALYEPWYLLYFYNNITKDTVYDTILQGSFVDYK